MWGQTWIHFKIVHCIFPIFSNTDKSKDSYVVLIKEQSLCKEFMLLNICTKEFFIRLWHAYGLHYEHHSFPSKKPKHITQKSHEFTHIASEYFGSDTKKRLKRLMRTLFIASLHKVCLFNLTGLVNMTRVLYPVIYLLYYIQISSYLAFHVLQTSS